MNYKEHDKSLFWGLLLVLAGVILLAGNLDFWPDVIDWYVFRWESLLILIGLLMILIRKKLVGGLVVMGIGGFFLLDDLNLLHGNWEIWFWPALLLVAGIGLILTRNKCRCC